MLVLSGRDKEVLNLGGMKLRPQLVEDVLAAFPAVEQAAVVGVPDGLGVDELWALIVPRAPLDEPALRAHCAAAARLRCSARSATSRVEHCRTTRERQARPAAPHGTGPRARALTLVRQGMQIQASTLFPDAVQRAAVLR